MASLRVVKQQIRRRIYLSDDSNDDHDNVPINDQTIEQFEDDDHDNVPINDQAIEQVEDDDHDNLPINDQTIEPVEEVNPNYFNIEKILDFEEASNHPDSDEVSLRNYLVKWKGLSYLQCSWVPEKEFQKAYKVNRWLRTRVNKFNTMMQSIANNGNKFVAIRPEWTTIDRIIASRGEEEDEKQYLVKYKELSYDECYWEFESDILNFQNKIQKFNEINSGSRRDKNVDHERIQEEFKHFDHTPEFLTGSLHPYQLEGLNFLRFSRANQTHVILADEMGLGKTVQSIAFLASLFEENLAPHLVIAPLSTLQNWEKEFATWAPHVNVVTYIGNSKARSVIREHEFYFPIDHENTSGESKQDRIKFDVLITSYEMIQRDTTFLKPIKWKCMIVDEGHRLKNKESKLFSSLSQYTSEHRVLLTGTPLQNNLDELFMLMHFLDAGKFDSLEEFQEEFKEINQEEQISKLHKLLAPHLLRRVKKDVLKDMPPKKELILRVDLSSRQKEFYKDIITKNYKVLGKNKVVQVSNVLMELRKVCSHPYVAEGVEPYIEDANEAFKQLVESCGKLQLLDKMMVKLKEQGHRVLIYTQFQHMLDLLEYYCTYKNWFYERIDGKVSGAERQARIDSYNAEDSNRFCFLLSTRAGGLGINLATADTVIIYDSDWNPHADLQAMARAHRLGQTNKVMIYRLINRNTIEEKMIEMSKKKMLLEHLVVGKMKSQNLSQEELDDIIKYGSKELFTEENEEARKFGKIHYDDAAIEKLLDRELVEAVEVLVNDEEENGFLKAFKVANFECIDENDAATLEEEQKTVAEEAQAKGKKSVASDSEREKYWEELLKDKFEAHQEEELSALGKRKRNCIKKIEENYLALIELSSDDEFESNDDGEASRQRNQIRKTPYKKKNHDYLKSIKLMGFSWRHRKTFVRTLFRYGIENNDWNVFVPYLKIKTYQEIEDYGALFLKHISGEDFEGSQDFSEVISKEVPKSEDILARITLLKIVKKKVKFTNENPTKPVFSDRILDRVPQLKGGTFWKHEHDKKILHGVSKHGFGKWVAIVEDKEYDIFEVIRREFNHKSGAEGTSNGSVYDDRTKQEIPYREMVRKYGDFVRRRFNHMEEAIAYEKNEENYYNEPIGSSSVRAEQVEIEMNVMETVETMGVTNVETGEELFDVQVVQTEAITQKEMSVVAIGNRQENVEVAQLQNQMSESLSAIGTDHDVEMKDPEEKAAEVGEIEVIVLD